MLLNYFESYKEMSNHFCALFIHSNDQFFFHCHTLPVIQVLSEICCENGCCVNNYHKETNFVIVLSNNKNLEIPS